MTRLSGGLAQRKCPKSGKLIYPKKSKARQAARRLIRFFGVKHKVYECPYCDGWHTATWKGDKK